MFKRLFFLSGIIAFVLAVLAMWFWFLPNHHGDVPQVQHEMNQADVDSVVVDTSTVN